MTKEIKKKRRRGGPATRVMKLDATIEEMAQRRSCEREETRPVFSGEE